MSQHKHKDRYQKPAPADRLSPHTAYRMPLPDAEITIDAMIVGIDVFVVAVALIPALVGPSYHFLLPCDGSLKSVVESCGSWRVFICSSPQVS